MGGARALPWSKLLYQRPKIRHNPDSHGPSAGQSSDHERFWTGGCNSQSAGLPWSRDCRGPVSHPSDWDQPWEARTGASVQDEYGRDHRQQVAGRPEGELDQTGGSQAAFCAHQLYHMLGFGMDKGGEAICFSGGTQPGQSGLGPLHNAHPCSPRTLVHSFHRRGASKVCAKAEISKAALFLRSGPLR